MLLLMKSFVGYPQLMNSFVCATGKHQYIFVPSREPKFVRNERRIVELVQIQESSMSTSAI